VSFDQPIPDPTAAQDPTWLQSEPQPQIDLTLSSALRGDLTYNVETSDSMQLEIEPPAMSELHLELTIAGEPQLRPKCRFDLPDGYELKGLPEYNHYSDADITDPNILPAPPDESGDEELSPSKLRQVDENWGAGYSDTRSRSQAEEILPSIYHIVTPPKPSRFRRGFNPNVTSKWRRMRRVPQFPSDVKDDITCPHCNGQGDISGKCWDCGRNIYCKSCGEPVGADELCKNSACWRYTHTNDDPQCSDCHEFVTQEGEVLCEECQQKRAYVPL
jgi:hypothetical protein